MKNQETYTIVTTIRGDGSYENVPDIPRISKENQGKFVSVGKYLLVPPDYVEAVEGYFSSSLNDRDDTIMGYWVTSDLSVASHVNNGGLVVRISTVAPPIKYHSLFCVDMEVDATVISKIKNFVKIVETRVNVFPV